MFSRPAIVVVLLGLAAGLGRGQPYVEDSIDVGGTWVGSLAYNRQAGVIYGTSEQSGYFFAISCDSARVISTTYRDYPLDIAFDSTDCKAYFVQRSRDVDSVIVIDGHTHRRTAAIPLMWANKLVWDGESDRLYVSCNEEENAVAVIDCSVDTLICMIPVGEGPLGLDINTRHRKLYVRNVDGYSVSIVDMQTNQVLRTIPVGWPSIAGCYHAGVDKYYCDGGSAVVAISGARDSVVARIPLQPAAVNCLCPVPSTNQVMTGTSMLSSSSVYVIDASADTVLGILPVGRDAYRMLWSPLSRVVYCTASFEDRLYMLTDDGGRVLSSVATSGNPFALALARDRGALYVGHLESRMVYVIRDTIAGIAEQQPVRQEARRPNTILRGSLLWAGRERGHVVDAQGRTVAELEPGRNDLGRLAAGVYMVVHAKTGTNTKLVKLR